MKILFNILSLFKMSTLAKSSLIGCIYLANMGALAFAAQTETPFTVAKRFNIVGQITGVINPDPDDSGPLNHLAVRNTYNSQGLLSKVEQGELSNWLSETVQPKNWTGFTVHSVAIITYDSKGLMTSDSVQDTSGTTYNFTQYFYDSKGRIECIAKRMNPTYFNSLATHACSNSPVVSQLYGHDRITKYTYDNFDQILETHKAYDTPLSQRYQKNEYRVAEGQPGLLKSVKDAKNNETIFGYDSFARLNERIYEDLSSNFYVFDSNNNLKTETKRNGTVFNYGYNASNLMTVKSYDETVTTDDVAYAYTAHGLLKQATKNTYSANQNKIVHEYNNFGILNNTTTSEHYIHNFNERTLKYEYDLNGNREKLIHDDNQSFTYHFDGMNRAYEIINHYNQNVVNFQYNEFGRLGGAFRNSGTGAATSVEYDDIQRMKSFSHSFKSFSDDVTTTMNFNPVNQIVAEQKTNANYRYNGNENRVGNYISNNLNQYTNAGNQSVLTYDLNGNMTFDGQYTYIYDDENRLVTVSGLGKSGSFEYDALGRLYSATINNVKTFFLYDGNALVAEYFENGNMKKRYMHGVGVDVPLIQYDTDITGSTSTAVDKGKFLHADSRGSIIAYSDEEGDVKATNAYDSYGIPESSNSGRFAFTGQIWFEELGLYYYKARIYHPKLGRFLQTDPIGYEDGMNWYAYVGNDPVNFVDPSGMAKDGETGAQVGMAILVGLGVMTSEEAFLSQGIELPDSREILKQRAGALAKTFHGKLDPVAQKFKTTAVGVMEDGSLVVASSDKNVPKVQREFAEKHGIKIISGNGHAEETLVNAGATHVDASRKVCIDCETAMKDKKVTTNTEPSGKKSRKRR